MGGKSVALLFLLAACTILSGCSRNEPSADERKPEIRRDLNVLLVTIDTLRADYLSCYGNKNVPTPRLDALAARGVRFEMAIAQVPLTAPSHASILSGTYPHVHGIRDMGGFALDRSVPTLATTLSSAGFETAAFVGAAVLSHHYGMSRGFATYDDRMNEQPSGKKVPGVVAEVRGEVITKRALEWLEKAGSAKPFLLWAHYYDPHFPYDPPEPYRSRHAGNAYGGEVAYADGQVGRLLDGIAARGILDRTLVVVMSDHGESLGEHGEYTHGVFLYDSTMRVPLIIAGPGIPSGRVVHQQVRSIDVFPTIADFAGVPPGDRVEGVSLKSAMLGSGAPQGLHCYMETLYPKTQMGWSELRGMRTDTWKFILAPKRELYRLTDDSGEISNVFEKYPGEAGTLQKRVHELSTDREGAGTLQPQLVDEERRRQLNALGYVGAGRKTVRMDMSGPDPKDRVEVLGALERASEAMNNDRWREAIPSLERISHLDPANPLIYRNLELCYERTGLFDLMETTGRRAIENKAASDETYANLGEIYIRRGNLARAVELMEKSAQMNPANLQNMDNLATAYLQLGKPGEAQRVLQAILVQDPRHAMAHNVLGILEIQRNNPAGARRHFEQAIESNPNQPEPYMNLGLLAQRQGDSRTAVAQYRQFLKRADKARHRESIPKVRAALADLGAVP